MLYKTKFMISPSIVSENPFSYVGLYVILLFIENFKKGGYSAS